MAWLHTWAGLIFGWILFPVFLTGAIALFWAEISFWGAPEIPHGMQVDRARATALGQAYLQEHAPDAQMWRINLPRDREPLMRLTWRDEAGQQVRYLNPQTGQRVHRVPDAGIFFIKFHFTFMLDRKENPIGFLVIGTAAMAMLVACISGIIIHKRIFKDLFTFRPRSSAQRSWLDGHNLLSVLPLPFHIMITYTGLVILYWQYMPAAVDALYDRNEQAFRDDVLQQDYMARANDPAPAGQMMPLYTLVRRAEAQLGRDTVFYFFVHNPNQQNAIAEFYRRRDDRIYQQSNRMVLNAIDGSLIRKVENPDRSGTLQVQSFTAAMHFNEFGGRLIRWLYFIGGLAGAGAIATGLVLFERKRAGRRDHQMVPGMARLIATLNLAAVAGVTAACAAYFWAERLIPATQADRGYWTIFSFFMVWLASLLHAGLRPTVAGWAQQLAVAGAMFVGIPLLAPFTMPDVGLPQTLSAGDWVRASIDLTALVSGLLLLLLAIRLGRRAPVAGGR